MKYTIRSKKLAPISPFSNDPTWRVGWTLATVQGQQKIFCLLQLLEEPKRLGVEDMLLPPVTIAAGEHRASQVVTGPSNH